MNVVFSLGLGSDAYQLFVWSLFLGGASFLARSGSSGGVALAALAVEEFVRSCWSYVRSPRRLEKSGSALRIYFRKDRTETIDLSELCRRDRWSFGYTAGRKLPQVIELLDRDGNKVCDLWAAYMSNGSILFRIVPTVPR